MTPPKTARERIDLWLAEHASLMGLGAARDGHRAFVTIHVSLLTMRDELAVVIEEAVKAERENNARELQALRDVHTEARELIGEADASGVLPAANLNALRSLLWRASLRKGAKP